MTRPWIIDSHGANHYLGGPQMATNEYPIEVIAHACAQINRFTGHCRRPYSVAEHQLLCADIAQRMALPPIVQLACLLHDAHEMIVGDCSTPVKRELGNAWELLEAAHADALRKQFALLPTYAAHRTQIRHIDLIALATERRDLTAWAEGHRTPWEVLDTPGRTIAPAHWIDLAASERKQRSWHAWRGLYLERYHVLRPTTNPDNESA